jgi:hypothetical protein
MATSGRAGGGAACCERQAGAISPATSIPAPAMNLTLSLILIFINASMDSFCPFFGFLSNGMDSSQREFHDMAGLGHKYRRFLKRIDRKRLF